MDILNLLCNPNGRIGSRDFWRGVILLVGAMIVLQVGGIYGGGVLSAAFGLLVWVMPYFYLCVFGKRLHDSGRTAWFYILALVAYFILTGIFSYALNHLFAPSSLALQDEMELLMRDGRWMDAFAYGPEIAKLQMIPTLLSLFATNGLIGYVMTRLKSDPYENQYGPPTETGAPL